jgi:hypothetical protein
VTDSEQENSMPCRIVAETLAFGLLETGAASKKTFRKDLEVIRHQEDNQGWVTTVTLWRRASWAPIGQRVLCDCHV